MLDRRTLLAAGAAAIATPSAATAASDASIVPIRFQSGRIGVDVSIGGQGTFGFVLDTGGVASLVDAGLARRLRMPSQGTIVLGVSGDRAPRELVTASDLVVGGAFRTRSAQFATMSGFDFGKGFVGSLDAGFLTALRSELLLDRNEWRIGLGPEFGFTGYERISGAIEAKGPRGGSAYLFANVDVEGHAMRLLLDTGAPGTLRLSPAAVRRSGILDDGRTRLPVRREGRPDATAVRAASVRIGGIDLGSPIVTCSAEQASPAFPDGLIGLRLLRLMNLATDPPTRSLYLRRNDLTPLPDQGAYADL